MVEYRVFVRVSILISALFAFVATTDPVIPTVNTTAKSVPQSQPEGGQPTANSSYLPALEMFIYHGADGRQGDYYYDSSVRPSMFSTLHINISYYLLGVGVVDEKKGYIGTTGILYMQWVDERLKWTPSDFGNIRSTIFEGYKIWSPKFFHNGALITATSSSIIRANAFYTGDVIAEVSMNEETPCRFDMTKFPRDTQKCYIHLFQPDYQVKFSAQDAGIAVPNDNKFMRSHQHTDWKIDNVTVNTIVDTVMDAKVTLAQHPAWEIRYVSMDTFTQPAGVNQVDVISISITMKRNASFFLRIYVTPVCFLLLLIPVIFLLPPDSSEKLTYGAVLLFCMIYVSETVEAIYPPYTDSMPYLIRLTTASGALLFLCILLTSLISSAERIGRRRAVPAWIKRNIIGKVGKFVLVKENEDVLAQGSVHIKTADENDRAYIVQHEESVEFSEGSGGAASDNQTVSDAGQALQSLVNELKQTRLQNKAYDNWTNLFTIVNRILFLLTLAVGIIIIFCFA